MSHRLASIALLAFALPLAAQSQPRLIGFTQLMNNLKTNTSTCATQQCAVPGVPVPPSPIAGGTAYDANRGAVWMTNGFVLGMFDPLNCAPLCPPFALGPILGNALATGLALNENKGIMFLSDNMDRIHVLKPACPMLPGNVCSLVGVLPAGYKVGGIASDDVNSLLFYAASDWSAAVPNTIVYVAPQNAPCAPICKFQVPNGCIGLTLGHITGVAYQCCRDIVWLTDGRLSMGLAFSKANCSVQLLTCCAMPGNDRYVGLCIEPSHPATVGSSCTAPNCAPCATMAHDHVGDPTLGNPSFGLRLVNAPANASSLLVLNLGACNPPGIPIGIFCGPLLVPLAPTSPITVLMPTGGTTGCTGGGTLNLAIPLNPFFCGITLSSQFLIVCPSAAGIGTGVSNCLSWTISST